LQQLHRDLVVVALRDLRQRRVGIESAGVSGEIDLGSLNRNLVGVRREVFHDDLGRWQLDQEVGLGGYDHREGLMRRRGFQASGASRQSELAQVVDLTGRRDGPQDVRRVVSTIVVSRNHVLDLDVDLAFVALSPSLDRSLALRCWPERRAGERDSDRVFVVSDGDRSAANVASALRPGCGRESQNG